MILTLNQKADMWYIAGKVHLTFESRVGEVDIESLTVSELKALAFAVTSKTVHVSDLDSLNNRLKKVMPIPVVGNTRPAVTPPDEQLRKALQKQRDELTTRSDSLLLQDDAAVKKVISKTEDVLFLKFFAEYLKNKKRKPLQKPTDARISELSKKISKDLGEEDILVFRNSDNDNLVIEEELGEEVTVATTIPSDLV